MTFVIALVNDGGGDGSTALYHQAKTISARSTTAGTAQQSTAERGGRMKAIELGEIGAAYASYRRLSYKDVGLPLNNSSPSNSLSF